MPSGRQLCYLALSGSGEDCGFQLLAVAAQPSVGGERVGPLPPKARDTSRASAPGIDDVAASVLGTSANSTGYQCCCLRWPD